MIKHVLNKEQGICETPFFVADVDAMTRSAYRDIDCPACLRQALAASEARTRAIRELIAKATVENAEEARDKSDGQLCLLSHYASIVDAKKDAEVYQLGETDCPDCLRRMADKHATLAATFSDRLAGRHAERTRLQALCHECSEVVDVFDGKLDPHHGQTGDGCPRNGAEAQIYLHPKVADLIAELATSLVFAPGGAR